MLFGKELLTPTIIDIGIRVEIRHMELKQEHMDKVLPRVRPHIIRITRQMVGACMAGWKVVPQAPQEHTLQIPLLHRQLTQTALQRSTGMRFHSERCQ